MLLNIYRNIITDSDLFQNISPEIYVPLTRFIAKDIDNKTCVPDVEKVVIIPSKGPASRCHWLPSPNGGNGRFYTIEIKIDHNDATTRTLQWIQIFAHEYMHHSIDRKEKSSDPHPLVWFDEMLCNISSTCVAADIYLELHLNKGTELHCVQNIRSSLRRVMEFPALVSRDSPIVKSIRLGKGIREFLPLPEEGLDLSLCSTAIASCVQNLFLENPHLWKIVPHVNEIPIDADIHSLFQHLKKTADHSYQDSLDKLINLLLPCR